MRDTKKKESEIRTWIMIILLVIVILLQGLLSFHVVGNVGQPDWDFGIIKDIPGESPYGVYPLDNPQHVKGLKGERPLTEGGDS